MNRMFNLFFMLVVVMSEISIAEGHVTKSVSTKSNDMLELAIEREPIVIRVTGYGAFGKKEDADFEPKRLMALRASKLDAYRALAERVYGATLTGTSTVEDFVMKHDDFGIAVDSFVRGARVVSISENKGAGFETVLELLLPGDFQDCLTKVNSFRNGSNCLRPLPSLNKPEVYQPGVKRAHNQRKLNAMEAGYYLK